MNWKAAFLIIIFPLMFACSSDDEKPQAEFVSGRIVDAANVGALFNCEWLVEIEGTYYVPKYLNNGYKEDGLEVLLKVAFLEELAECSTTNIQPNYIRIEQIRPAN
ncbi:hypothetical protein [Roseivirga pacifica]|uniref:hypothetical protein n=1 Tax=Roseivirga pacifica TaxID=1267423 RepID=UPI003BAA4A78